MGGWQRWLRASWIVPWLPARFRTNRPQPRSELEMWIADQLDPESRGFDAAHGISTSWFDLGNYEPTPPSVIRDVLDALPTEGRTFVDLGSGKGRVVLLASERLFLQVIGVEYKRTLHWRAKRNVAAWRGPRAAPIRLVCADAADWDPPEGPLTLFLYNPFSELVLRAALARVRGRDVHVAYVNPIHHGALLALGFEEHHRVDHPGQDRCWRLYKGPRSV